METPAVTTTPATQTPSSRQTTIDTLKLLGGMLAIETAVIAYTIYTMGLYRDARWKYFILSNSLAAIPVVGIEIFFCLRWARGVIDFNAVLAAGREPTREQQKLAVQSIFLFARNGALLLALLYPAATAVFALGFYHWRAFSALEALFFFAFKSISGVNLSVFFYYAVKAMERPYLGNAVARLLAAGDYEWDHFKFSIRYKIFLVIFCIVAFLIFAAVLMGFNQVESAQIRRLEQNLAFWQKSIASRLSAPAQDQTRAVALETLNARLAVDADLVLLRRDGRVVVGAEATLRPEEKEKLLLATGPGQLRDYLNKRLIDYEYLAGPDLLLAVVGRWEKFASGGTGAANVIVSLFVAAIVLSVAGTVMLVGDINTPLRGILEFLHGVSRGSARPELRDFSEDELGAFMKDLAWTTALLEDRTRRANDLVGQLEDIAEAVRQSFDKVKAATDEQARGVNDQADAAEAATSIGNGILELTRTITARSAEVEAAAALNLQACREGDERVALALAGVRELGGFAEEISKSIIALGQDMDRISRIVGVIEEISDQVGLLSLNAELEAVGAGAKGVRFGVVAQEVKRLADRTMETVAQISHLIDSTIAASNHAVGAAKKGLELVNQSAGLADAIGRTLKSIKRQAELTESAALKIKASSDQQTQDSQKMAETIAHVHHSAHAIKDSTGQVLNAMEELAAAAGKLSRELRESK